MVLRRLCIRLAEYLLVPYRAFLPSILLLHRTHTRNLLRPPLIHTMDRYKLRIQSSDLQLDEQVKDRYFRLGIAAAELLIPLMFYGIWMRKGFKFEETGTYTSTTFRGLFNRFRPTKK